MLLYVMINKILVNKKMTKIKIFKLMNNLTK